MKTKHWMLIKRLCTLYIGIVVILLLSSIMVFLFGDYGVKPPDSVGCYAYDALLIGFGCSGFNGAEAVAFGLNYPLYHLYMPIFIIWRPVNAFFTLAMYAPYFLVFIAHHKVVSARV
ncbi:hypothetical protein JEU11_06705 [Paraglaciecola chathamensis]|uniref:Uncharacterized protein n=1 Tax=Paraglaciecola chathamensis TaxID=368405 RepID=A0ABS0WCE4_9ALTE|nr:hypothetical protein [Paraglaciecola chathamensis]MBJ2136136.1 hypothetical protein [Paraglaciecola chathamensis]